MTIVSDPTADALLRGKRTRIDPTIDDFTTLRALLQQASCPLEGLAQNAIRALKTIPITERAMDGMRNDPPLVQQFFNNMRHLGVLNGSEDALNGNPDQKISGTEIQVTRRFRELLEFAAIVAYSTNGRIPSWREWQDLKMSGFVEAVRAPQGQNASLRNPPRIGLETLRLADPTLTKEKAALRGPIGSCIPEGSTLS